MLKPLSLWSVLNCLLTFTSSISSPTKQVFWTSGECCNFHALICWSHLEISNNYEEQPSEINCSISAITLVHDMPISYCIVWYCMCCCIAPKELMVEGHVRLCQCWRRINRLGKFLLGKRGPTLWRFGEKHWDLLDDDNATTINIGQRYMDSKDAWRRRSSYYTTTNGPWGLQSIHNCFWLDVEVTCPTCSKTTEDVEHVFFYCPYFKGWRWELQTLLDMQILPKNLISLMLLTPTKWNVATAFTVKVLRSLRQEEWERRRKAPFLE